MLWANVMPIAAITTLITSIVIVLSYYLGEAIGHPKITLWAKTEIVQLFISIMAAIIILTGIQSFCAIDATSLSSFVTGTTSLAPMTIYDAAYSYLYSAADFTHKTVAIERYYLGGFNLLEGRHYWNCQYSGCDPILCCLFGTSGMSSSPFAYASVVSVSFNIAFNSTVLSYLSSLNYLFILKYAYSGILLFMLPLGILLRATPYMRNVGSLLIAVCIAFMIIYPTMLAMLYLFTQAQPADNGALLNFSYINEDNLKYATESYPSSYDLQILPFTDDYSTVVFPHGRHDADAIMLAGKAFLLGVFFPTVALLASIASIKYVSKTLGEDIDLSRVIQMV